MHHHPILSNGSCCVHLLPSIGSFSGFIYNVHILRCVKGPEVISHSTSETLWWHFENHPEMIMPLYSCFTVVEAACLRSSWYYRSGNTEAERRPVRVSAQVFPECQYDLRLVSACDSSTRGAVAHLLYPNLCLLFVLFNPNFSCDKEVNSVSPAPQSLVFILLAQSCLVALNS